MPVHYLDPQTWRPLCGPGVPGGESPRPLRGQQAGTGVEQHEPWTFVRESVTCSQCLRVLAQQEQGRGS